MTKKEYLDKLYYEIGNMSGEQKDEIISIFIEHFEQGALDGKSEEEICAGLGQPANVAAQFIENNRDKLNAGTPADVRDPAPPPHDYERTRRENEQYERKPEEPRRDEYAMKPGYGEVNINKAFAAAGVDKVNIDMNLSDIKIKSGGDEFRVMIHGHARNSNYEVYVSDGVLNIIENKKFVLMNLFNFVRSVNTEVYIPTSFAGTMYLKDRAGNVYIDDVRLRHTELHATAGDIRVNRLTGDIELRSAAGNMSLNGVRGNISMYSTAGDIKAEDCDGDITSSSTAGNVKIYGNKGHISAKTTAGNIKIEANDLHSLKASSSAGNVKIVAGRISGDVSLSSSAGNVKLETREVAGSITVKTSFGNATVMLPRDASMRINAHAVGKCKCELVSDPNSKYLLDASASLGEVSVKVW